MRKIKQKSDRVGRLKSRIKALEHTVESNRENYEHELRRYRTDAFSGASAYYRYKDGKVDVPGKVLANAIFLNYDILLQNKGDVMYAKTWDDVELLPPVAKGMRLLTDTDYVLIVLAEAPQVGLGEVSFRELDQILIGLYGKFDFGRNRQKGLQPLDAWYICPHAPFIKCACKAPLPGLVFRAAVEMDICLAQSWLIGQDSDEIKAGIAADVGNLIYIMSEEYQESWTRGSMTFPNKHDTDDFEVPVCWNLLQAAQIILRHRYPLRHLTETE